MRGRTPTDVWRQVADTPLDLLSGDADIPLYLGAVVIGIIGGAVGYAVILSTWRKPHGHKDRMRNVHPPVD